MACFLVPAAEAVIVTAVTKAAESKEKKAAAEESGVFTEEMTPVSFTKKAKWLRNMLWGGSFLLAFEHVWHGEVVPWFPFLSAASNPADAAEMLQEMAAFQWRRLLQWYGDLCSPEHMLFRKELYQRGDCNDITYYRICGYYQYNCMVY